MPRESDDPLRKQNIRDRFAGTNDPVAAKILGRMQKTASKLSAPRDTDIKTLWAGGLDAQATEQELRCVRSHRGWGDQPLLVAVTHPPPLLLQRCLLRVRRAQASPLDGQAALRVH